MAGEINGGRRVRPQLCTICGSTFTPKRPGRRKMCGDPACRVEMGRRSAGTRLIIGGEPRRATGESASRWSWLHKAGAERRRRIARDWQGHYRLPPMLNALVSEEDEESFLVRRAAEERSMTGRTSCVVRALHEEFAEDYEQRLQAAQAVTAELEELAALIE